MSAPNNPLLPPVVTALLGMLAGAIGTVALRIARWRLDAMTREELLRTISEYRSADADKDRLLVQIRDQAKLAQVELHGLHARQERDRTELDRLLRRDWRRDRYVRSLQRQLRDAGCPVPIEPAEEDPPA